MRSRQLIDPSKVQNQSEADVLNANLSKFTETLPDNYQLTNGVATATKDDEEYMSVLFCEPVMSCATRNPPVPAWLVGVLIVCLTALMAPHVSRCLLRAEPAVLVIMYSNALTMMGTYLATSAYMRRYAVTPPTTPRTTSRTAPRAKAPPAPTAPTAAPVFASTPMNSATPLRDDMGQRVMTAGRHSGKTFHQIVTMDPGYVRWIRLNRTKCKSRDYHKLLTSYADLYA